MSISVIYSLSLPPGYTTYSATTLTAAITTIIPTTSVYTTEGRILTTTTPVATVVAAGTTLIFPTPPEPKPKKGNLVVIIAASLGGFIGLVLIGVGIIIYRRRSKRVRPASPDPRPTVQTFSSPSSIHHSSSIRPFAGYQPPEYSQPHHEPQLMSQVHRDGQNNVVMAPPSQPLSEKQRRNLLQRGQQQQRSQQQLANHPGMMSRSSMDDNVSMRSQPYTTSSIISSQQQPATTPGHQHHRTLSANSVTPLMYGDGRSTSPVATTVGGAESPPPRLVPSHSYLANANAAPASGMRPLTEEVEDQYYPQQHQQQNPRQSVAYTNPPQPHPQTQIPSSYSQYQHPYPNPVNSSGAGGSSQPQAGGSNGASVTIDRGTGDRAEVILAKNSTVRQPRNRFEGDINDSTTNLSELPPTYDSLRQRGTNHG